MLTSCQATWDRGVRGCVKAVASWRVQFCWRESVAFWRGKLAGHSFNTATRPETSSPVAPDSLEKYTAHRGICGRRAACSVMGSLETFSRHPMGRSLTRVAVGPVAAGTRSGEVAAFDAGSSHFTIEQRDGRILHRESRCDEQGRVLAEVEAEVTYALGSGSRGTPTLWSERAGFTNHRFPGMARSSGGTCLPATNRTTPISIGRSSRSACSVIAIAFCRSRCRSIATRSPFFEAWGSAASVPRAGRTACKRAGDRRRERI